MAFLDPTTREKFARFRQQKRAWFSLWMLTVIFVISLFSNLIANDTPWRVRFEGNNNFPRWQHVSQDHFLNDGVMTRPNFRELQRTDLFREHEENRMWWAPIPYGPHSTVNPVDIPVDREVTVIRRRVQRVGSVNVDEAFEIMQGSTAAWFFGAASDADLPGKAVPSEIRELLEPRFANQPAPARTVFDPDGRFEWSLPAFEPRAAAPRRMRITLREAFPVTAAVRDQFSIPEEGEPRWPGWWEDIPEAVQERLHRAFDEVRIVPVRPIRYEEPGGYAWEVQVSFESIHFPFRPVRGHPMGFDESGRDVLVQVLYAARISLSFGFLLVISSVVLGTILGALQGYFGGWIDLIAQRLIEIYQSIPFLYVMIFIGSVFGRSFVLLLLVYAVFNWISISYYMRAEFLRLRRQPFTEAAKALGLPTARIMWFHLLPNALVPIITFFPFMLVGAIGSLNALDFLGFGLPAGTPSWGSLLRQAQTARHAWWLITYSSLALFIVILLTVFIGEGLRAAFDPKREAHWEA
jgi:microcin C transport system permease protein